MKIASRGFDDFHQNPIVLHNGNLIRCPSSKSPKACILAELAQPSNLSISDFLNTPVRFRLAVNSMTVLSMSVDHWCT